MPPDVRKVSDLPMRHSFLSGLRPSSAILPTMCRAALLIALILFALSPAKPQTQQSPSPMVDHTRPHPRITQTETPGRRVDLKSLKGAKLFIGPGVNPNRPVPLLIHFHGASWLVEQHVARYLPRAVLITVNLGAGSSAYRRSFEQADLFQNVLSEAAETLGVKRGWASITLSGFSAGYGAVREILRRPEYFALVNNVLLLDGMHASYSPEGKLLADGGTIQASDVDVFVNFARAAVAGSKTVVGSKTLAGIRTITSGGAVAGRKTFVVTHSEIFPGAYASTTECADYLLSQLSLKRNPRLANAPMGMQQLSAVDAGGFHLRGYAGNSAPDHIDFLHAMPAWFGLLYGVRN
jgi:hypothetical protein